MRAGSGAKRRPTGHTQSPVPCDHYRLCARAITCLRTSFINLRDMNTVWRANKCLCSLFGEEKRLPLHRKLAFQCNVFGHCDSMIILIFNCHFRANSELLIKYHLAEAGADSETESSLAFPLDRRASLNFVGSLCLFAKWLRQPIYCLSKLMSSALVSGRRLTVDT